MYAVVAIFTTAKPDAREAEFLQAAEHRANDVRGNSANHCDRSRHGQRRSANENPRSTVDVVRPGVSL